MAVWVVSACAAILAVMIVVYVRFRHVVLKASITMPYAKARVWQLFYEDPMFLAKGIGAFRRLFLHPPALSMSATPLTPLLLNARGKIRDSECPIGSLRSFPISALPHCLSNPICSKMPSGSWR